MIMASGGVAGKGVGGERGGKGRGREGREGGENEILAFSSPLGGEDRGA